MEKIINQEFGGERPLYFKKDLYLENVTIHAGESSLKETANIEAYKCTFEGKYPFWCCNKFTIKDCHFTEGARAALWYSKDLQMSDTLIEAPKMFREMDGLHLKNIQIPNAGETLWHCSHIVLDNVSADNGDYILMHCSDIEVNDFKLNGNYSFQYTKNVVIRNSVLNTKDAFWMAENVTVYDSEINGEFLGWYSKNLRLVNCKITGTQPLCYAEGLAMENCTMGADANLAFEYSTVEAIIDGLVTSVKNPRSGHITASGYGEIIIDENLQAPGDCKILTK